ncbi:MAG: lipid-A-disaccharide synthase [Gammaproteobacteria bacterium]|nr:lipid-A-disaccharide synthase [Gammaproteobacteria bacterium]MBP9729421.1 lipid-A-disaccharide synthase [Gammaproteobacteria bacterium]
MALRIGLVVGESSGDHLAAGLIAALRKIHPDLQCEGILGPELLALGGHTFCTMDRLSVMGLVEPLKRLPELYLLRHRLLKHFIQNPPDVFIGVDAPDFNLGLALKLKAHGIKTVHYVSPSVWAWRPKRILKIKKAVDLMLTLFPFEAAFYEQHQVPVCFVGHPLADQIPSESDQKAARQALNIPEHLKIIALLPGSRQKEIDYLAGCFIESAVDCFNRSRPDQQQTLQFVIPLISEAHQRIVDTLCHSLAPQVPIKTLVSQTPAVLAAADAVLVASGTATLETMLYKKPMIVAYRMHPLTYAIARRLVKVPFIALPNLLANQALVPEYIQKRATPALLGEALYKLIHHREGESALLAHFKRIHLSLKKNASDKAAKAILAFIKK